jgi:hypothetical protein
LSFFKKNPRVRRTETAARLTQERFFGTMPGKESQIIWFNIRSKSMTPEFEQTVNSLARFKTYSLSLVLLNKSVQAIRQRGADDEAVRLILQGIRLLNSQLTEAVEVLQRRQEVERFISDLQRDWEMMRDDGRETP